MGKRIPTVAIIGRANVGKSTLFNALAGRQISIVRDQPGVTRDRNYALIKKFPVPFTLIDTAGLLHEDEAILQESIKMQINIAIQEADLILAVLDGISGVHPNDHDVVNYLRRSEKPIIWVVNKCEKPSVEQSACEFFELGIEDPFMISAAHNVGVKQLLAHIKDVLKLDEPENFIDEGDDEENSPIRIAVIGKPNVGKSTFINTILKEDRLLTSNIAGTTRDSIDTPLTRDGRDLILVDTAGLRRKNKVDEVSLERDGNERTIRALATCDVAVLVLDVTQGYPTEQDAKIAGLIHERGRALVIVANKWDAIEKDHRSAKAYQDAVYEAFKFVKYAPVLFTSASTGRHCSQVIKKAIEVYDNARLRIPTSELNKIINDAFEKHQPPAHRGETVKIYFAVQISVAPPTIVIFTNHPSKINFSYERYLTNKIREKFPFAGVRIKLIVRKKTAAGVEKEKLKGF